MANRGFINAFIDVWLLDGVRTPMVDYCGALGHISPTDLGIKVAREALRRSGLRYGIASACVGGGQGSALQIENARAV
ncbi:MAG: hypothetical protein K2X51_13465 [Burkholderiales bacterium]|nr:hypothetical protein [Burkholderiales bacterium]